MWCVLLSIINLFVDMFGIGSLFAMLSSFTNNDLPMLSFLNNYDDRTLVILFSTIFLIVCAERIPSTRASV